MSTTSSQHNNVVGSHSLPAAPPQLPGSTSIKLPPKLPKSNTTSRSGSHGSHHPTNTNNATPSGSHHENSGPAPLPGMNKDDPSGSSGHHHHTNTTSSGRGTPSSTLPTLPPKLPSGNATPSKAHTPSASMTNPPAGLPPGLPTKNLPKSLSNTNIARSSSKTPTKEIGHSDHVSFPGQDGTANSNSAPAAASSSSRRGSTTTTADQKNNTKPDNSKSSTASPQKEAAATPTAPVAAEASPSPSRGPQRPRFPARMSGSHDELVARLTYYFEKYSPNLISQVPLLIQRYGKREGDLWDSLFDKYGPEPDVPKAGLDLKTRLVAFFRRYDPKYESKVDKIMMAYSGHEDGMWKALYNQYGPEDCEPADDMSVFTTKAVGDGLPMDLTSRLRRFFEKHDSNRVGSADQLAFEFADKETELKAMLKAMYFEDLEEAPESASRRRSRNAATPSPGRAGSASRRGGSPTPSSRLEMRSWLREFFTRHSPERSSHVDELMEQFTGREDQLFEALEASFGHADAAGQLTQMDRLVRFFAKYEPEKTVPQIESFKDKYRGKEKMCWDMLISKYGPEPDGPVPDYSPPKVSSPQQQINNTTSSASSPQQNNNNYSSSDQQHSSPSRQLMVDSNSNNNNGDSPSPSMSTSTTAKKDQEQPVATAAGNTQSNHRGRLLAFYKQYDSSKIPEIDQILSDNKGQEDRMWSQLVQRYGPEPQSSSVNSMSSAADNKNNNAANNNNNNTGTTTSSSNQQPPESMIIKHAPPTSNENNTSSAAETTSNNNNNNNTRSLNTTDNNNNNTSNTNTTTTTPQQPSINTTNDQNQQQQQTSNNTNTNNNNTAVSSSSGAQQTQLPSINATDTTSNASASNANNSITTTSGNDYTAYSNQQQQLQNNTNNNTADWKTRFLRFYTKYDPKKANDAQISKIMGKYEGREEVAMDMLKEKYQVEEPTAEEINNLNNNNNSNNNAASSSSFSPNASTQQQALYETPNPNFDHKTRLLAFYQQYDSAKATDAQINKVLDKYSGMEDNLWVSLTTKYGPEPVIPINNNNNTASSQPQSQPATVTNTTSTSGAQQQPASTTNNTDESASYPPAQTDYRGRLIRFYQHYDASKATDEQVDKVLGKYAGREQEAFNMLEVKYGPENAVYSSAAPSTAGSLQQSQQPSSANMMTSNNLSSSQQQQQPQDSSAATSGVQQQQQQNQLDYRTRLLRFYQKYDPSKANDAQIDRVLGKYSGREEQALIQLSQKFGVPEPTADEVIVPTPIQLDPSSPTGSPSGAQSAASFSNSSPQNISAINHNNTTTDFSASGSMQTSYVSPAPTSAAQPQNDYRARLFRYYQHYDPTKATEEQINKVLEKYAGREEDAFNNLAGKYGPESAIPAPDYRGRLFKFYKHYDASKATDEQVDKVLGKYAGREQEAFNMLEVKYGPESAVPQ